MLYYGKFFSMASGQVVTKMKLYFYQANFCAECGNEMKPRAGWGPRYFCDECSLQMGRTHPVKWLLAVVLGSTLLVSALHRSDRVPPVARNASVSAIDATARREAADAVAAAPAAAPERTTCGARTKKGTPCKHITPPGERCAQHRGMASMLEPAMNAKDAKQR